jgi:hypothetical protein
VIHGDDVCTVPDPALRHRASKTVRGRDLCRDRIVGGDDILRPVNVNRTRDMACEILLERALIARLLDAGTQGSGDDVAPAVGHAEIRFAQMGLQPTGRHERVVRCIHGGAILADFGHRAYKRI